MSKLRYPLSNLTPEERIFINVLQGKIYRLVDRYTHSDKVLMEWDTLEEIFNHPRWKMYSGVCIQKWNKGEWHDYLPYEDKTQ